MKSEDILKIKNKSQSKEEKENDEINTDRKKLKKEDKLKSKDKKKSKEENNIDKNNIIVEIDESKEINSEELLEEDKNKTKFEKESSLIPDSAIFTSNKKVIEKIKISKIRIILNIFVLLVSKRKVRMK